MNVLCCTDMFASQGTFGLFPLIGDWGYPCTNVDGAGNFISLGVELLDHRLIPC